MANGGWPILELSFGKSLGAVCGSMYGELTASPWASLIKPFENPMPESIKRRRTDRFAVRSSAIRSGRRSSISAEHRADQLEEDIGILLHAIEELKRFAAGAVCGYGDVSGGVHSLISADGLPAQEVAGVLVRGAIGRRGREPFAGQLAAQVRGQQTVSDRQRLRQPRLEAIAAGAIPDQQLPVHVKAFRVAVGEDFVFRKAGGVISRDQLLAFRLHAGVQLEVVRRHVLQTIHLAREGAD